MNVSHNIKVDLNNMTIHFEYDDTDKVIVGDSIGLIITHVNSTIFKNAAKNLYLIQSFVCACHSENFDFCSCFYQT